MMKSAVRNIREVARLAKVAPSTVSLVFNGSDRVAEETRAHVLRVLHETGYHPVRAGRKATRNTDARPSRTSRIALVRFTPRRSAMHSPVYMDVIRGVEEAVSDADMSLVLRHLPLNPVGRGSLFQQRVDGIILFGAISDPDLIEQIGPLPCVEIMGHEKGSVPWDHLTYANHPIGRIAAEYLRGRGHTRTAAISFNPDGRIFKERVDVFRTTWKEVGGSDCAMLNDPLLLREAMDTERIDPDRLRQGLDHLLSSGRRPTALFLVADMLAAPVQNELMRRNLVPGRDIEIVSCNNERLLLDPLHPRPATVDIHAEKIGRRAVAHLLWRMEHPLEPRQNLVIEPELVCGDEYHPPAATRAK